MAQRFLEGEPCFMAVLPAVGWLFYYHSFCFEQGSLVELLPLALPLPHQTGFLRCSCEDQKTVGHSI
jgi:hypothetical protein